MYVKIQQDDGQEVDLFGVSDFVVGDDGEIKVWYFWDSNLDDRKEPVEGDVMEVLSERNFGKKWEAKEAIENSARSEAEAKVVTTPAHPQVKSATLELKENDEVANGFTLIA